MSWCAIIIQQQQLLFDIVTHPKQTLTRVSVSRISQREITLGFLSPAGEMNFHVSFSSRFSRFSKQIISSSRYTRFCPLFLILRKFTFLKVGGVFPPPPFGTRGVIFRMKDGILKLRPKGVDGCLMTGAIQDHFVGFRLMTILAGQSYISEVNIFCCDVKAEEQIINYL